MKIQLSFILCFLFSITSQLSWAADTPNVLVFLVDDMGLMDTSVPFITNNSGKEERHPLNDFYRTPSMKRLSDQGIRLSHFYAMSVCSPTRASILSGQTSARHYTTQFISPEKKNTGSFGPSEWKWKGFTKDDDTFPKLL